MILSPGRRVDIVKYFKKVLNKHKSKVITLDMSNYAPALYSGDKWYTIQKNFNNLDKYIDDVIRICKKEKVTYLMTLIDPELKLIAENVDKFKLNNIIPIISSKEFINNTFDKYLFYKNYKDKLNLVPTYIDKKEILENNEIEFPIFTKDRKGSGSSGLKLINNKENLKIINDTNLIYQKFIDGKEFGVDVYFDFISGKIVSVFMKEKINMRAGETDKSVSVFREDILNEIMKLEDIHGIKGPIDVDVFISNDGELYINEINPRFGGGYPHAYGCGVDFISMIGNNMMGGINTKKIGEYPVDILMMKYNGIIYKKGYEIYELK
jgi:carbamoyl-phosphate synthase large subunit